MKKNSLITRPATLFILLMWVNFNIATIQAQEWTAKHIRGDIYKVKVNKKNKLKENSKIDINTNLIFSKTSDMMVVRNTKSYARVIHPEGFTNYLSDIKDCNACIAIWEDLIIVSDNKSFPKSEGNLPRFNAYDKVPEENIENYWGAYSKQYRTKPAPAPTSKVTLHVKPTEFSPSNTLQPGSTLQPGASIFSPNKKYKLIYQPDGNLVLYRLSDNIALWSTETAGSPGGHCSMQANGNLVIYKPDGKASWAAGTWEKKCKGSKLVLKDDGNLVIIGSNTVWWESKTSQGR